MRTLTKEEIDKLIDLYDIKQFQDAGYAKLKEIVEKGFAIEKEVAKESILFISMNPSYKDGAWNNGTEKGMNAFYDIPILKETKNPKDTNSFFQAINRFYKDLAEDLDKEKIPPLAHHDLLFIRETTQETVENWIKELDKKKNTFFKDQLEISKTIIEESNPKLIVVLNAGAKTLFEQLFKPSDEGLFEERLGAYLYQIGENKTPVLFSGMLSGQRALDLGSRRSLRWHVEYILKQL